MSFQTGTQTELLFSSIGASTNLATFTTEDSLQKTLAPIIIPAGFFYNNAAVGKSLKVKYAGLLGTTATPTFTFTLRLCTGTTWATAGSIVLGASGAVPTVSGVTLAPWFLEADIIMRNVNVGGASVVACMGEVRGTAAFTTPFGGSIPVANVSPVVSTIDNSTTYYLFLSAACSASSASNLINTQMIKVYGEN